MKPRAITSEAAPAAIGPYSQALVAGNTVYLSGQIPLDPVSMTLVGDTAAQQLEQCIANAQAVLATEGLSLGNVVRSVIYLVDLKDFTEVNAVYERYFSKPYPARTTIQVAALPRASRVELELTACF